MKVFTFLYFSLISCFITCIKCYIFSVVMAIYNTGRYLNESISSILNQTVGYQNIQIILINDGSSDNSEEICLTYQRNYPNNIIYKKIENSGVSNARNIGMKLAKGEYINFLDPDDRWDYKAFEYILSFFKNHKDINFVSGRMKFFEARKDYHILDYKFYKTRVVNLTEEYNCIHSSSSTSFFRSSIISGKKFEENILSGEDTRFVNLILLTNPTMGLIREAIYFCRKRNDYSSRTQTQKKDVKFYFLTIQEVSQYLIDISKKLYNKILPFIQFYVAYDILFRIETLSYKYLNLDDYQKYCKIITNLLQNIDDKYILEQKVINNKFKIVALSKKYNRDLRYAINLENGVLKFSYYNLIDFKTAGNIIIWKKISIKNDILHLEGVDNLWIPKEKYFYIGEMGGRIFYPKVENYSSNDFNTLFGLIETGKIVIFDIPLTNLDNIVISFNISFKNETYEILTSQGYFTNIPSLQDGYYISDNYIIKIINRRINLYHYNRDLEKCFERKYCHQLEKLGKTKIINLRKENKKYRQKKYKNEIWIINDKKRQAGDNGEYFFRYLRKKKLLGFDIYFVIEKNCSDFHRLESLGNIIDLNSDEYLKLFLKSDKILSSVSNFWVDNPFGEDKKYIRDLYCFEFIFIQNGILKDDLSKMLNRLNRNIDLFVVSTQKEYNYLLSTNYGYKRNNLILSGLPRFDILEYYRRKTKKEIVTNNTIIVFPTWRLYIKGDTESFLYESIHSESFKNTLFFKFYNNLINDLRLMKVMKLYNYTGVLCLHKYFSAQWEDFKKNELFEIREICNYQELLIEGSLLITDYSSVFFDFSYLKKPIIYTHFDYKEYRSNHYPEGYFNYNKDGFGPIANDINGTVNYIIENIKDNCKVKNEYLKRINSFFIFHDQHNSDRIFKRIIKRRNKKRYNYISVPSKKYFILFLISTFLKLGNIVISHIL